MSTQRNSIYNIGGPIFSLAIILATVPLYLALIGEARFGTLALIWVLTSYFLFFDMGSGRVAIIRLSRVTDGDPATIRPIFWTGLAINAAFGLLGAVLLLIAARGVFTHLIDLSPPLQDELFPILPIIALGFSGLAIENLLGGALAGRQHFLALNMRLAISTAFTQIIPLLAVWHFGPSLAVAVPAMVAARWLAVFLSLVMAVRILGIGWKFCWGGRKLAAEMLHMGKWIALADGLRIQLAGIDRFLIGAFINATGVARYTVPYQLVMRGAIMAGALPNALFPRLSRSNADDGRVLAQRALHANAAMMLIVCTGGIIAMHPFLSWWINAEFAAQSALVGQIITISLWLYSLANVPLGLMQAQGRMRESALITAAQFLPFLLLARPGMLAWGIAGMAGVRALASAGDLLMLAWRMQMFIRAIALIMPIIAYFIIAIILVQLAPIFTLLGSIVAAVLILGSIAAAMIISSDLRNFARSILANRWRRQGQH